MNKKQKTFIKITILTAFLLLLTIVILFLNTRKKSEEVSANSLQITTDSQTLTLQVELAQTAQELSNGLMNRTNLCENCGMLFIFPDERVRSFWMKNTLISLDIIFADNEGIIVHIAENSEVNQTDEKYSSIHPVKYILEVNAGYSERNDVTTGNKINVPQVQ
ncbi:DUF192 domain-containing protein [Patescibacteria group bacterium]